MVNEFCFVSGQPPSQPILCQNPYPWTYPERYGLYQSRLYTDTGRMNVLRNGSNGKSRTKGHAGHKAPAAG